ncbi:MAG TPA: 2-dehydropantoate 2-reductase N-terminal domain-containing protein, partial [Longimicrobiales bacterium]|nr:2-dehydropantoate 2-reductase N-terminal domain-containing protein [Longimicrobiales bacterium]
MENQRPTPSPLVIWGAGAMGGSIGAWLIRANQPVLLVDADRAHCAAIAENGLRITGPLAEFTVDAACLLPEQVGPGLKQVFLAVKAHHTEAALDVLAPLLADDGYVVSVQNGLNERVIARRIGEERTVGCFVNFGADVMEPGVIQRGNRGAVVVGELNGAMTSRAREVHTLLSLFERDAVLTDNIWGYLWGKLAYGSLLFATALAEASIADVLDSKAHRPVLVELGREVMRVAAAQGIRPEGFDGFNPRAFGATALAADAHDSLDRLVAFNRASAKTHSGVWRDLAVRKRKTEVDAQIAPIAELGD